VRASYAGGGNYPHFRNGLPSADFRDRVEQAVRSRVENEAALQRMEEIQAIIERIDFRWDHGFIDKDEYFDKRVQFEREMESLRPLDYDELHEAADLIQHFRSYWDQCAQVDDPEEARQQLLAKIVDQVFVYDDQVVAIALHGDFHVILDDGETMPLEIAEVLGEKIDARHWEMTRSRCGSDGARPITCIRPLIFIAKHVADDILHHRSRAA
jgi:hypothetical protein